MGNEMQDARRLAQSDELLRFVKRVLEKGEEYYVDLLKMTIERAFSTNMMLMEPRDKEMTDVAFAKIRDRIVQGLVDKIGALRVFARRIRYFTFPSVLEDLEKRVVSPLKYSQTLERHREILEAVSKQLSSDVVRASPPPPPQQHVLH
jgi:hypothetical protein